LPAPGIEAIFVGKSSLSTSRKMGVESTSWPLVVKPDAVSLNFRGAVSAGTTTGNCAGNEVAISLNPIGNSPTRITFVKTEFVGDETVTETVCPGLTTTPLTGEVICNAGWLC
jgi:hypothetical protein